ncbi:FtsH protease activity modulator HflK [Loktanella sp. IMCC34160]|uniref:FtsH protease activity modulator HflK n=1 Tax=Loktanella sp. IMCC34160 TaxID=2510646 RepID=UPI00101BB8FD|nr:FtsH protease activity modulator HflK [Loktanella sp. IMCC34160]RYG90701.1 FtsH protease activity modulator HflK [Loktanella sp. IMCC34160]
MAGNYGGPWGGGGNRGPRGGDGGDNGNGDDRNRGPQRPNEPQIPELDELMNKGREQLRVLMGGGGGGRGPGGTGGSGGPSGPLLTKGTIGLGVIGAAILWGFASFYTVKPEERSINLFLGEYMSTGEPGLNFAPWPVVTAEVEPVTTERNIAIGTAASGLDAGLMLTGDENIVDIDFEVVWNISNLRDYKFNLAAPAATIEAVSESAMREIIAQSEMAPILNRDRGAIADRLKDLIQSTLDSYDSGVNIVRVNLNAAEPPSTEVAVTDIDGNQRRTSPLDAFRDVQDAEQERDQLQNRADAYANRALAEARGQSAQLLEEAEAYRAQVVNEASGEASRFSAVLAEYRNAPEVTRKRLYLETMEQVLGGVDIILLDDGAGDGGNGVVPYLPLNEIRRSTTTGGSN